MDGESGKYQLAVSDHLGTPRMIIDQTGTLASVKRHDYLPFGEELSTLGLRPDKWKGPWPPKPKPKNTID